MTSKKLPHSGQNATSNLRKQQYQKNTKSSVNQTVTPPKISYTVAHAIPGRIRFRIPRLGGDSEYANKLQQLITSDSRIKDVRINPSSASLVISYQRGNVADGKMRSHLIHLIQNAPNIALPAKTTTKPIVGAIFDAVINFIDSTRNINQARQASSYQQPKKDIWERVLEGAKTFIKGIKSAVMFILPNKRSPSSISDRQPPLQPSPL
ncbi:HMA2 domain-containing protein [Anabaena sp. UHCC 0399]|uniref:HMA2 domain-containing protein n=1 Tax=Anabaena sp. UHCC 0399 TaxID=3110238 RepID=UPI002B1E9A09|nr:hypothetical protein [Anabaena sp. UHCC 0399]MEA5569122.1 hypothetical protein [Anabaena sp. UHCC 0399]